MCAMEEQARLTLVVPLSGGSARARDSAQRLLAPTSPVVFPLARLADGDRRVLRERDYEHLALVGAPPLDEIGYGLTPLIALAARPRHVALIDLERERLIVEPLRKHLVRAAPFAAVQVLVSAAAVAAQRAAVPFARGTRHRRAPARELSKIVYIRPAAGS